MARLDAEHVPATSGPKALEDLLEGRIHFLFDAVVATQARIASGRWDALAVSGRERVRERPDVPTLMETGASGDWTLWGRFIAPAGTPAARIAELNAAIRAENERGGYVDDVPGTERPGNTPEAVGKLPAGERTRYPMAAVGGGVGRPARLTGSARSARVLDAGSRPWRDGGRYCCALIPVSFAMRIHRA